MKQPSDEHRAATEARRHPIHVTQENDEKDHAAQMLAVKDEEIARLRKLLASTEPHLNHDGACASWHSGEKCDCGLKPIQREIEREKA